MIVSNEPGYYEEGGFGIRIENLLVARPRHDAASGSFGGTTFLGFEQLTQVPIQLKMLAPELMSAAELAWLDEYHALVWSEVSARLEEDSDARRWLRRATRPVHEQSDAARGAGGLRAVRGFC
jgi:Xaa-Pro aminopeptidase